MQLFSDRVVLGAGMDLEVVPARIDVEGAHIVDVVRCSRDELGPEVDDLGDRLVAPSFVNTHTHLSMSAFRGLGGIASLAGNVVEDLYYRIEQSITADDVRAFARIGAMECLLAGTGTVWDHYYFGEAIADALVDVGISGVVGPTVQDLGGPGADAHERAIEATRRIAGNDKLRDVGIVAAVAPHATDTVSADMWGQLAELAAELDCPWHFHLAQSLDEVERSWGRHDCAPLTALLRGGWLDEGPGALLVHSLFVSEDEIARLDGGRHVLGYCPWSQAQFAFPAHLGTWLRQGIRFALGTDAGACNDTMCVQQELRVVAAGASYSTTLSSELRQLRREGGLAAARSVQARRVRSFKLEAELLQPETVLAAVWSVPGQLHPHLPAGEIRVGALANLTVYDLDHPALWPATDPLRALVFGTAPQAIHGVVNAGRWRGEPGRFVESLLHSTSWRDWRSEARQRLDRLLKLVGE